MGAMNRAARLLELQEYDLALERIAAQLAEISRRLGESAEVAAARAAFEQAKARVTALERQRQDLDFQVQQVRAKREREEQRLYGGEVRQPKEIEHLQREVESLRRRTLDLQDRELAVMAELEEAEAALAAARAALASAEQRWQEEQATLRRQQAALLAQQEETQHRREAARQRVDPQDLPLYQALRARLAGRAVARIERGVCAACRVSLPEREIQKARTSPAMVTCSNCGRILAASA